MLKCILFLLSEEVLLETLMCLSDEGKSSILSELKSHGVDVGFGWAQAEGSINPEEVKKDHTLIVTDVAAIFKKLREAGFYVAAYYHEGNRAEDFSGAAYGIEDLPAVEYESYDKAFRRLAGIPWDILETSRMKVRESIPEDVEEFYRIYKDPSITLFMEDLYEDKEEETAYVKAYIKQVYGFYGFGLWTVLLKETGQVIGRAGLNVREGYELPELGFVIDVEHQRQGYAYEVCQGILDHARKELEFDAVQAFVDEGNLASIHLLKKLGFVCQGEVEADRRYLLYVIDIHGKCD